MKKEFFAVNLACGHKNRRNIPSRRTEPHVHDAGQTRTGVPWHRSGIAIRKSPCTFSVQAFGSTSGLKPVLRLAWCALPILSCIPF
jgi:hypothetical protein